MAASAPNSDAILQKALKAVVNAIGMAIVQDLMTLSGLSERTVRRFIKGEKQAGNIIYDPKNKRLYSPSHLTSEILDVAENLGFIRESQNCSKSADLDNPPVIPMVDTHSLLVPDLDYPAIKTLCRALHDKKQVYCHYQSRMGRLKRYQLSPHHMVYTDNRYHLRAYNHASGFYSDYVLGRFKSAEMCHEKAISSDEDKDWRTQTRIIFEINPEHDEAFKDSIRLERNLRPKQTTLSIETRVALKKYIVRYMTKNDYQTGKPVWIYREEQYV